jgi:hypothetical protein
MRYSPQITDNDFLGFPTVFAKLSVYHIDVAFCVTDLFQKPHAILNHFGGNSGRHIRGWLELLIKWVEMARQLNLMKQQMGSMTAFQPSDHQISRETVGPSERG